MKFLDPYNEQIRALCIQYHVKSLYAFGSVVRNDFTENSDVDMVVEIDNTDPVVYTDNYFNLKFRLEDLLHREVDLLEKQTIRNTFLQNRIEKTKVPVYER